MVTMPNSHPKVVIVGGGFAGLWAARVLSRSHCDVHLLSRDNYHTFPPLLYQVAAAEIEPEEIAYPLRTVMRRWPAVKFAMVEALNVDFDRRIVETSDRDVAYDYLILAMGGTTNYLEVNGAAENAYPLKTLEHAIKLRNHILCCFEHAIRESDESVRLGTLTFTIVGGGASGVEFAGAVAELINGPFREDFPDIDFSRVRVVLLEAGGRLLPDMKECCSQYVLSRIRSMGVEVMLNAKVEQVTRDAVLMADGTKMSTHTVVWTAGVQGEPVARAWGLPTGRGGRVTVLPTLQIPGHPEVYAAGDLAYTEFNGHQLPMTAPVAIQEGTAAACNILRQIEGVTPTKFQYRDKGTMVTIGRNAAVARIGSKHFKGFFAWILWLAVHIFNLIGFRNRVFVLINWARDYIFADRPVRLILSTGSEHPCGWEKKS